MDSFANCRSTQEDRREFNWTDSLCPCAWAACPAVATPCMQLQARIPLVEYSSIFAEDKNLIWSLDYYDPELYLQSREHDTPSDTHSCDCAAVNFFPHSRKRSTLKV